MSIVKLWVSKSTVLLPILNYDHYEKLIFFLFDKKDQCFILLSKKDELLQLLDKQLNFSLNTLKSVKKHSHF
jgi:GTP1/Obg family GTP-binding protein